MFNLHIKFQLCDNMRTYSYMAAMSKTTRQL